MRKIIFLLFTILAAWQVKAADKVRFVAEAADVVVSGDQVRLVFTVNSQDIKDFRAPSIKVLPQDQNSGNSGNNGGGSASSSRSQAAGSRISANDLFITATAAKPPYTSRKPFC